MSLIGLDIGTTGCKAIVFAHDGGILGQSAREYGIAAPYPGWAEQDPILVWSLAWSALKDALAAARLSAPADLPLALAISCQGEAVIPVDAEGNPLRPAILGMDTRTVAENHCLRSQFGADALFERTGMPVHTINTLPKLLWIQRNEPDIWRTAHQFLLYEDFFLRRLGGEAVISRCLASRTQMMDIRSGEWAEDLLAACEIDPIRLARLGPASGGIAGHLRPELARELGVDAGVALACGGHDQACAATGSGVIEPGLAMVSTGTAEVVEVAMDTPALTPTLRDGNISVYRHVVPGLYLAMTLNHSGGLLLRWYRDTFGGEEVAEAIATGQDAYDLLLMGAPDGPTPLMVLPHFAGSGTPWLDTESKGAVLGMTFDTDRATVAKAIIEGLTFELRINLDLLRSADVPVETLHAVGGGARNPIWLQLKADVCQVPLRKPRVTEAACLGAALAAGVATGAYTTYGDAVASAVGWQTRIEPQPASVNAYDERFALYRRLYPLLSDFQRQL